VRGSRRIGLQIATCLAGNRVTWGASHGPLARGLEALEAALGYVEMPRAIHVAREGQAQGRLATRHVAMKEQ